MKVKHVPPWDFFLQDVGVIKIYMYACRVGKTRKPKKLNQMQ
jgi:hypothetical protein